MEHVVEVGDVGDRHAGRRRSAASHALGTDLVERIAQVERIGDWVEHGLGRHVGKVGMQSRRQLDAVGVELPGELRPLLDREVGVGVAALRAA